VGHIYINKIFLCILSRISCIIIRLSCSYNRNELDMTKGILIFILFIIQAYYSHGQTITLREKSSGTPVERATLRSDMPRSFAVTNAEGQADISAFTGADRVEIRCLGFKTEMISFQEIERMNFEVVLSTSEIQLDGVVISATRWSQTSRNIPFKVSVISTRDIAVQNPQTAADLLATSGEVFVQKSQQGGGSPMIRGFSTNRLLYTIDGVRMNSAIFRAGNLQNVISLNPFAIENTEVLFGPGSVIYGSDAIGGVMSFHTLTPQFSLADRPLITGKGVSRFSSANSEQTHHFDVGIGWKRWAAVTSLTYSKFGDLRMGKYGPDAYLKHYYVQRIDSVDRVFENPDPRVQNPSGYAQMNLMQKIRFSPNKKWDLQYGFHYSETSDYSRYDRLIETSNDGFPASAIWNYGPQVWMMNLFTISKNGNSKLYDQMTIRLAQQYFEESRIDRRFNHHRLRTQLEEVQAYSANIDFEKSTSRQKFYYGLEYVLNDVSSHASAVDIRNGNPIAVPDRYPTSSWSTYAGYLNYQLHASESVMIQAGARFSRFNISSDFSRHLEFFPFNFSSASISNSSTTGSIGMIYRPSETWKITLNVSSGFRAPNVDDIGKMFDFGAAQVVVPNPDLGAEYAYNGEFGVTKLFDDLLKFDATAFYTYLDNAMVRRAFQVNGQDSILYNSEMSGVYAIQNAAYGYVYGFNAGIELLLPSGFRLSARYNFQRGWEEMENGDLSRSRHAAPVFGVTRLSYRYNQLLMQFYVNFSAEVSYANLNEEERQKPVLYATDNNGNPYSPGWHTLNFKADYRVHKNLSIQAGIENITDRRYRPYSSGLVAPGRNFVMSLKTQF
jgi:hemoglobin/transferrin/lactoferrin receptor protein